MEAGAEQRLADIDIAEPGHEALVEESSLQGGAAAGEEFRKAISGQFAAEGLDPEHPGSGEEALVGPYFILRNLRLLRESLLDIETHGRPRIPGGVRTRPDGQVVARIFPIDLYDRVQKGAKVVVI